MEPGQRQYSYNGDVANTATLSLMTPQDPRNLSLMSYSDNHFRHKVVFYGTLPLSMA